MRFVKTAESIFDIPSGFKRVEYLQSTGTQYIDTGFVPTNDNFQFEIKMFSPNTSAYLGYRSVNSGTATGDMRWFFNYNDGRVAIRYGDGTENSTLSFNTQTTHKFYFNGSSLYVDDVNYLTTTQKYATPVYKSFYLFSVNTSGYYSTDIASFVGRIYYAKIWDNGTLVRDFIPCIDSLGVPCMYDLVGKKPYYNAGTGNFTAGRHIIPVEYLEGTGTQYIDTGVRGFADFEIGVKLRESVSNVSIFCGNGYRLERYNASNPYWRFRNNNDFYNSGVSITEYHVMAWKNDEIYADGVKLQDFAKTWNVPANMTLFGASASGSYPSMIYFCKLWNPTDGTLLRDFIPCKDENDIGFMFDSVSGTVYENAGTGAFVVGQNKYKTKLRLVKDNKLPAGYTQVEYLESSRTQWIDTGINPENANTKQVDIETNFAILTPTSDQYTGIFGAAVPRFGFYTRNNNMCFGYYAAFDNVHEIEYGKKYNLKYNVTKSNQSATLDGVNVWTATRGELLQNTYTIGLFCRNYSTPQWRNNARIYDLTIAIDGTLVRNFIPALDPTGTPCMYDMVTKTPFYNQGTGTFSYGKTISMVRFIQDVIPREYAAVNYIESTGTQYIDTGIEGKDGITAETRIQRTTTSSNECFVGAYNTVNRLWLVYTFGGQWYRGYNTIAGGWTPSTPITDWYTVKSSIPSTGTVVFDCNGTSISSTYTTGFNTGVNVQLFQMGNTGTNHYPAKGKMSYCKLYDNNTLVRNFVPVVRRVDKVAGMWDTVTKQFFGNSGTGNFNYG